MSSYADNLSDRVAEMILEARNISVFTGAGISTESGLPDFRSPGGIWDRFAPEDFTYQKFISRHETRQLWWQLIREGRLSTQVKPNRAHYAIAELERMGKLDAVITQNIDNLHQTAGVPNEKVFELHGNLKWSICLGCGRRYASEKVSALFKGRPESPVCDDCSGILKPNIVFFGEMLPEAVLQTAMHHAERADLMLVIGTSLVVRPAADVPLRAYYSGAKLVIINLQPTPMDNEASVLIRAQAGEVMSGIMERVRDRALT